MLYFLSGLRAGASCLCLAQRTSHSCPDDGHCTMQASCHSCAPRPDDCFGTHPLFLWLLLTHLGDGMVSPSGRLNETGSDTFLSSQPMARVSVHPPTPSSSLDSKLLIHVLWSLLISTRTGSSPITTDFNIQGLLTTFQQGKKTNIHSVPVEGSVPPRGLARFESSFCLCSSFRAEAPPSSALCPQPQA